MNEVEKALRAEDESEHGLAAMQRFTIAVDDAGFDQTQITPSEHISV